MSVLMQQRDAGQSEWWAQLFALQLGFSVSICQPAAVLPSLSSGFHITIAIMISGASESDGDGGALCNRAQKGSDVPDMFLSLS